MRGCLILWSLCYYPSDLYLAHFQRYLLLSRERKFSHSFVGWRKIYFCLRNLLKLSVNRAS